MRKGEVSECDSEQNLNPQN